jgi:hypothetical protein
MCEKELDLLPRMRGSRGKGAKGRTRDGAREFCGGGSGSDVDL